MPARRARISIATVFLSTTLACGAAAVESAPPSAQNHLPVVQDEPPSTEGQPTWPSQSERRRAAAAAAAQTALASAALADSAAAALFPQIDLQPGELESLELHVRWTRDLTTFLDRYIAEITRASAAAQLLTDRFEPVMALQAPWWSIVASVRQAQIYDGLVASILAAISPPRLPRLSGMEDASPEVQAEIQAQLHSRLEASIRTQIAPLECLAIVHYTLAVGIGTARSLESPDVAFAAERLDAYGPERVRACVR